MNQVYNLVKATTAKQGELLRKAFAVFAVLALTVQLVLPAANVMAQASEGGAPITNAAVNTPTTTVIVSDNTSAGENQPGWMFNRDHGTDTYFQFDDFEKSIGNGSLHVWPISETSASDKMVAEYFLNKPINEVSSISYDFMIGDGGSISDKDHFYLNVYANFSGNALKYYDCKYDVVPTVGSTSGFTTITFDPNANYPVTLGGGVTDCPESPSAMGDGSTIRMFALNVGDSSVNDAGFDGYLDNVVLSTTSDITIFDFEPFSPRIHFYKYLCEDYSDVYGNPDAANMDDTGGKSGELANAPGFAGVQKPVKLNNANEVNDGCELADGDWYFNLSNNVDAEYNQIGSQDQVGPTVNGVYSTTVDALEPELKDAIIHGKLWVSEVGQANYPFAAIRCYNDVLNGDNLEFISYGDGDEKDINCIAYNIGENPRPLEPCGTELILNPKFENPVVNDPAHWDIYPDGDDDLAWRVKWVRPDGKQYDPQAELHEVGIAAGWNPAEGNQYTELDSDYEGPGGSDGEEDASVTLYQKLTTVPGSKYTIKFSTSPRPNQPADDNKIGVKAGDLDIIVNNEVGGSVTDWTPHIETFTATGTETVVEFTDLGPGNSFGGFLDNVSVIQDCDTDVTLCKVDNNHQPLADWEVFLKGKVVDSIKVLPNGSTYSSDPLPAGNYEMVASGKYVYRPGPLYTDATYSERLTEDGLDYLANPIPWVNTQDFPGNSGHLGLRVDDLPYNWGNVFNKLHVYSGMKTLTVGDEIDFSITDDQYNDNSGFLTVDVYPIYKDITGDNGCVTLKDVPFGDYTLDELMKEGWEAVDGKGETVVVNAQTTGFTLVNKCTGAPCLPEVCVDGPSAATAFHEFKQGDRKNGTDVLSARSDANKALGVAENNDTENFVSLGYGGSIILSFGGVFQNVPASTDIKLTETSFDNPSDTDYPEKVKVEVSMSMSGPWTSLGEFFQDEDVEMGAVQYAKYIKLTDVTDANSTKLNGESDGYDVDGVQVSMVLCEQPEFKITGKKFKDTNKNGVKNGLLEHGIWNWKIYLMQKVDSFDVAALNTPIVSSSALANTVDYMIRVTGTVDAGDGIESDAQYSERNNSGSWTDLVQNYEIFGPTLLDLQIDGSSVNWGSYNDNHEYWSIVTGDGTPLDFKIYDTYGANNSSALKVEIYQILDIDYTNILGDYAFDTTGLEGELVVAEQNKVGWVQSAPSPQGFYTVDAGEDHTNLNFGNYPNCTVQDLNHNSKLGRLINFILSLIKKHDGLPNCGNGIYGQKINEDTQQGIGGWTIFVDLNQNGALDDAEPYDVTDEDGNYFFGNLPTGTYQVREVNQPGWTQISPQDPNYHSVAILEQVDGIEGPYDFVNHENDTTSEPGTYNIRGMVYNDKNNSNSFDEEIPDTGLKDWVVYIDSDESDTLNGEEVYTNSYDDGNYEFLNLPAGCYTIREVSQGGWNITQPLPTHEYIVALGVSSEECPGAVDPEDYQPNTELENSNTNTIFGLLIKTANADIVYTLSGLDFGNFEEARGGSGITSSGSGSRTLISQTPLNPQVLGETTTIPSDPGQVAGAATTLPRTGMPTWALLMVALLAFPAFGFKALAVKKASK